MSYKTILLVDDDKSNIHILVDAFGGEYKIVVAMDGESALQILGSETPDLILLDIMMPGLNGFEVLEFLKSSPATVNIPVIFLSSKSGPEDLARGLELGATYFLTKPFEIRDVKACISSFLQRTGNNAP
jgi:putative two-component system response regulator